MNIRKEKERDLFLVYKKGSFSAIEDGLPLLRENELRRMAAHWLGSKDAMIRSLDKLKGMIRRALSNPKKVRSILDRLPKRSYDLLFYIRSEGEMLTMKELRADFPMNENENLRDLLRPLIERCLVWECRQTEQADPSARLFLLETCSSLLELPSYLEGKYGSILPNNSKEQLYNLVRMFDGEVKKLARNQEVIPWLKTQLRTPSRLRRFFDGLELNERKALKILALHPDGLPAESFLHEFSLFSNDGPEPSLRRGLKRLQDDLGLIHIKEMTLTEGRKKNTQYLYRLPREMSHIISTNFKEKYRDHLPVIAVFNSTDEDFALSAKGKEKPSLWIDFQQLLCHLVRCEVGVIRKGGMHKKNLKRILDRLEGHPADAYHYLDFVFLYAYEKKIIYPEGERWKVDVKQILSLQDEFSFYRDFWALYRNNASWNDRDSSPLQGVLQKGDSPEVFALRRAILRLLCDCPIGEWIEMKTFFDQLCDREMAFRSGDPPMITNDPVREKYRLMKSNMERSLAWMGLVDTRTIPNQRIDLFRLTEIGAWLLKSVPDIAPFVLHEDTAKLTIQPNLEILIPVNFPLEKQLYLARFTDDIKGRILINRASIRRALFDGLSIREMQEFLEAHCPSPLSAHAIHLMEEVNEKVGHIVVGGEPICLEVNNQVLLDELLLKKQIQPYIQKRDTEKRALLRRGADIRKLIEELKRAGYSPRAS